MIGNALAHAVSGADVSLAVCCALLIFSGLLGPLEPKARAHRKFRRTVRPSGEPASVAGQWDVHIDYLLGSSNHRFTIEQAGNNLTGTHYGETLEGSLRGSVYADEVKFRSVHHIQGTSIAYTFSGKAYANTMTGTVDMGEYGPAQWTATRKA